MGLGYIRSSEYESWARLNRVKISPAELGVLKKMDRVFVAINTLPSSEQGSGSLMDGLKQVAAQQEK